MSYRENLKSQEVADSYWEKRFQEMEDEENKYENECQKQFQLLFDELNSYHSKYKNNLSTQEWIELKEFIREYDITPETKFCDILDDFIENIIKKYDFLY